MRAASPSSVGSEASRETVDRAALREVGRAHFRRTRDRSDNFFEAHADDVSRACWEMAKRFHRDGRLLVFGGPGPVESDAFHVSVEFVHPVLVGKRALPATVLEGDPEARVRVVGRPEDIALGISSPGSGGGAAAGLRAAREEGLLTVGLGGSEAAGVAGAEPDHLFLVPSEDPTVVQEVQETLYHVLWELVHVFFEHKELL